MTVATVVPRGLMAGGSVLEKIRDAPPIAGLERVQAERTIREVDALANQRMLLGRKADDDR
ncbi:MAG: hypothetical protein AAF530_23460 [Pseudomonadota bacterium]